jgi:hypothetical protein
MSKEKTVVKVLLKEALISYPALFEPEAFGNQDPKYKATFVVTDAAEVRKLQEAALEVGRAYFGDDVAKKIRAGKIKFALKKSDEDDGYPEGSYYIRATSSKRPGVVSIYPSKEDPKKPARIEDPEEVYPGAVVNASVVAAVYDRPDSKGITFYLNNVQKVRDGERLDSRVAAEDEFDVDADAIVDMADFESGDDEVSGTETEEATDDLSDLLG